MAVAHMKQHVKGRMILEGHTSDLGDADYNMALGKQRAEAVKKYMVDQGIDPARIETISYGETQPGVPNDSAFNRKINQRVGFKWFGE